MFHAISKQSFTGLLFLLLTVFSPISQSIGITFEAIYTDEQGTGFYNGTPLTETEKLRLHADGNFAQTLGEARRNAFEATLELFEFWLVGDNTVRVEASFGDDLGSDFLAVAGPADFVYETSNPKLLFPIALAENIWGQEINGSTEADVEIKFNENSNFYYGFNLDILTLPPELVPETFILIAVHEIIHGLGFLDLVNSNDGSFKAGNPSIYDLNLYSERDGELLTNLSSNQRLDAITSGTGLSWDGTSGGENSYSCAQLIGDVEEVKARGGVDSSGRPLLSAPNPYKPGSSVAHFHEATDDIMKPSYAPLTFIDLTFGVLRDIGWKLNRDAGDENSPFNVKDLLVSEVLEECTVAANEPPPPTLPEQRPVPESGGGGGCAIAATESMPQNTISNLFLVLSIILSVSFRRSRKILLSEK